jgi:A/G-specific adenine glycosylase
VKAAKKARTVQEMTVYIFERDGRIALRRRPQEGLLAGLWEFPNVPGSLSIAESADTLRQWGLQPKHPLRQVQRQHIFTHIRWDMTGMYWEVSEADGDFIWLTAQEINDQAALPTAFRQFWRELNDV